MFFLGKMNQKTIDYFPASFAFSLLILFIFSACSSWDASQYLSEQEGTQNLVETQFQKTKTDDVFFMGGNPKIESAKELDVDEDTSSEAPNISPYTGEEMLEKQNFSHNRELGYTSPGTFDASSNYLEFKNSDINYEFRRKGRYDFSMSYFRDTYDYNSHNDVFNKTFRHDRRTAERANGSGGTNDSKGSFNPGTVQASLDRFIYRGGSWFDLALGGKLGIGYNRGYGFFTSDNKQSDTVISLWCIPVDLAATMGINLTSWFKVSGSAGPSALVFIQSRSDRSDKNNQKSLNQVGTGYFAEGKFKISLSSLMPTQSLAMHTLYGTTKYYLDFVARMQSYDNFQSEDLSVSGSSLGVGLTFEYL